jgi:dGTPase
MRGMAASSTICKACASSIARERYGAFDGLNLMFETREGILKHCSPARARELGELGERFLEVARSLRWKRRSATWPTKSPTTTTMSMTACVQACSPLEQLQKVSLFARHAAEVGRRISPSPGVAGYMKPSAA